MTSLLSRRRLIGAIVLATSLGSGAALSQTGPRVADPLPARDVEMANPGIIDGVRPEVITIPCCKCAGSTVAATLSSGSVPWSVSGPGASGTAVPSSNPAWTPTLLLPAKWISPATNPTAVGTYTYSIQVRLPKCALDGPVEISGKFLADNVGTLVVDGKKIISSLGTPNYGFLPGSVTPFGFTLSGGGVHTISLQAYNAGGPTGAVISMTATRKCPGDPRTGELPEK